MEDCVFPIETDWEILGWTWVYGKDNVKRTLEDSVKVLYPKNSRNPQNKPQGGFGATFDFSKLQEKVEKLKFTYKVKFPESFEWVKGGKLHGLYFKTTVSGGEKCEEGGSLRFMWRKDGKAELYAYHPNKKGKYGDSFEFKKKFVKGEWSELSLEWKRRGEYDLVQATLSGETIEVPFNFKHSPTGVFYSTFFGGHDRGWRARKDEVVEFKDFNLFLDDKKVTCFVV